MAERSTDGGRDVGYWAEESTLTATLHPIYDAGTVDGDWVRHARSTRCAQLALPRSCVARRLVGDRRSLPMPGAVGAAFAVAALAAPIAAAPAPGRLAFWLVGPGLAARRRTPSTSGSTRPAWPAWSAPSLLLGRRRRRRAGAGSPSAPVRSSALGVPPAHRGVSCAAPRSALALLVGRWSPAAAGRCVRRRRRRSAGWPRSRVAEHGRRRCARRSSVGAVGATSGRAPRRLSGRLGRRRSVPSTPALWRRPARGRWSLGGRRRRCIAARSLARRRRPVATPAALAASPRGLLARAGVARGRGSASSPGCCRRAARSCRRGCSSRRADGVGRRAAAGSRCGWRCSPLPSSPRTPVRRRGAVRSGAGRYLLARCRSLVAAAAAGRAASSARAVPPPASRRGVVAGVVARWPSARSRLARSSRRAPSGVVDDRRRWRRRRRRAPSVADRSPRRTASSSGDGAATAIGGGSRRATAGDLERRPVAASSGAGLDGDLRRARPESLEEPADASSDARRGWTTASRSPGRSSACTLVPPTAAIA